MEQVETFEEIGKRKFVRAKEEDIDEGRPVLATLQVDLSEDSPLEGVKEQVRQKLESHEDHKSLFYPYFINKEAGITEAQAKKLMSLQTEINLLEAVVVPYIPREDLLEGDFDGLVEFQNYCLRKTEGNVENKSVILFRKWDDSPWLSDVQTKIVDYIGMYVGAHHYNKDIDEYMDGVENFFRIAELPVIGYGMPFSAGVNSRGSMYYMMDWNAQLPFSFYSEGDVPIGGSSNSDTNWVLKDSDGVVKEKINLQTADFDTEVPLNETGEFDDLHPMVGERTAREIAMDEDLEFMHETYLINYTEALE
mgnify:CR=1 FL=1